MSRKPQPLDTLEWIDPARLTANDYNPNHIPPIELALLKLSIMETGWTCPLVAGPEDDAGLAVIVDGFHRWTLVTIDEQLAALTGGLVPVVRVTLSEAHRRIATIRHNRARGIHGVVKMAELVAHLVDQCGLSIEEICMRCGMEAEEVRRLYQCRSMPDSVGADADAFGRAWKPTAKTT